jgi:hypothetical protein
MWMNGQMDGWKDGHNEALFAILRKRIKVFSFALHGHVRTASRSGIFTPGKNSIYFFMDYRD